LGSAAPGRPVRYEHEYKRQGSLALLAGLDVHTGQVFASTPLTTGIKPFMDLAGQVMARERPMDASERRADQLALCHRVALERRSRDEPQERKHPSLHLDADGARQRWHWRARGDAGRLDDRGRREASIEGRAPGRGHRLRDVAGVLGCDEPRLRVHPAVVRREGDRPQPPIRGEPGGDDRRVEWCHVGTHAGR